MAINYVALHTVSNSFPQCTVTGSVNSRYYRLKLKHFDSTDYQHLSWLVALRALNSENVTLIIIDYDSSYRTKNFDFKDWWVKKNDIDDIPSESE